MSIEIDMVLGFLRDIERISSGEIESIENEQYTIRKDKDKIIIEIPIEKTSSLLSKELM